MWAAEFGIGEIKKLAIPDELIAIGFGWINASVVDKYIIFIYAEPIMWTTSFGIFECVK